MPEQNIAQDLNLNTDDTIIETTDVMTGDRNKQRYLYYQLVGSLKKAQSVDIIVSFLMESGVKLLLKDLDSALDRGAKIRILTGNYLGITQPSALYLIKQKLGDRVDLRFYSDTKRSFHPKSYIFHYGSYSEIYIGSSNISKSALTSGIEWNYRFTDKTDAKNYEKFFNTYEDLFNNHSIVIDDEQLRLYSKNWHRPLVARDMDRYDETEDEADGNVSNLFEPRGAQIEALCALENSRAEGATKGLVQAATGVGKTYLAAFDSQNYERVLFVAHREEILKQAAESFKNVRNSDEYGFFNGNEKCNNKSVIFASVSTLGREEYLRQDIFAPDYFDYVVIDEFHHAVNTYYQNIVKYFKPKFLLGLTATPDRMDGRNIYEICDYNVPYEISLRDAINKGMLVPFHYYGIYDDTDYSGIHIVKGKYDTDELDKVYIGNVHRHDVIFKHYKKYHSVRALGFCCSRAHAEEMAREFSKRGVPSVAVYSNADGEYSEDREVAIKKLKCGEIKVIFSVDMFNEGVDIASVDMVMFLRPTESPIVFLQQLGRGLRRSRGKEFLNVLDFIGNYEKAGRTRFLLKGNGRERVETNADNEYMGYPDDCLVDFDMRLIDFFQEMDRKHLKVRDLILQEYFRVKEFVKHRPDRMELFTYMDDNIYQLVLKNSRDNLFKHYLDFLNENNEIKDEENVLYNGIGREFLNIIETTNMTKVYKMPVLMAFYNGGDVRMEVTKEQLLCAWKEFFGQGTNWKDLDSGHTYEEYKAISDGEHMKKIMQMPVHFLLESGKGFFVEKNGFGLALCEDLRGVVGNKIFAAQMGDIIRYRTYDYYHRRYKDKE
jgi:superfamily II DNA or RNA helicase/HKD family nuclease